MISSFQLKFGRTSGSPGEVIATTPMTVFVGPNNSGKSRILSEIEHMCITATLPSSNVVLNKLTFLDLEENYARELIERNRQSSSLNEQEEENPEIFISSIKPNPSKQGVKIRYEQLMRVLQNPNQNPLMFCNSFLKHSTLILNGHNRIRLINEQDAGDLQERPELSLQVLFRDDIKRGEVRRIILDAFERYFIIDPTKSGKYRIRLSDKMPSNELERSLTEQAIKFHADAQIIDDASDGVKAFTGIITSMIASDPSIVLIDEPEAFLHPPLATKLGFELSQIAKSTGKRVFISTHSSAFLMGCIQSGIPLNIVRLTYRAGAATARVLESEKILELMRKPLLRSTGTLNGLFYEFVVITESDSDRAFYQEINERLLQFRPDWGIPNCLFINAQNKQTLQTIIQPLRQLGIPAAAIADIDILKEGGTNWANLLESASIPEIARNSLATMRAVVKKRMDETGQDMKRDGGLEILKGSDREGAKDLLEQLSNYGIFVVPGGELESWLKCLEINSGLHGPAWLVSVFEKMGEDPSNSSYTRPTEDDVWRFLSSIRKWLLDSTRKGIPE